MSRLDDELRIAFKREEPSADFVMRILARLDEPQPVEKLSFWQRLALVFAPPAFRWVAFGTAAALIVAVVSMWQLASRPAAFDRTPELATSQVAPANGGDEINKSPLPANSNKVIIEPGKQAPASNGSKVGLPRRHRSNFIARHAAPKVDPEAEAAKQQVLFALRVANEAMNDVQRVIQQDSHNLKP